MAIAFNPKGGGVLPDPKVEQSGNMGLLPESLGFIAIAFQSLITWHILAACSVLDDDCEIKCLLAGSSELFI